MSLLQAIILAIVEGLTEFLPVSSTGHLIITSALMGIGSEPFTKLFTIAIQFGAIFSVVLLYYKRFLQNFKFYTTLFIAFLPAVIFGKLFGDFLDSLLENVTVVALALMLGGVVLLFMDAWLKNQEEKSEGLPTPKKALMIGLYQCLALIPGVSRSAATILGGMASGLSRKAAAEFSFFLAVPTLFAASVYKLYQYYQDGFILQSEQTSLLIWGNIVAFIVAALAIKSFISWITRNSLKAFGWYRIIVGILLLALQAAGINLEIL
jgi:undecaprenyl-diphosphatase